MNGSFFPGCLLIFLPFAPMKSPAAETSRPNILRLIAEDFGQHMGCYDSGLLVPLIIRWPKNFSAPKHFKPGSIDDRLLAAIDLAPTMLDLAGIPMSATMQGARQ